MPDTLWSLNNQMRSITKFEVLFFSITLLATTAAIMAGLGTRWEWWSFRTGFAILTIAAYGSVVAAGLSLIGLIWSGLSGSRFGFALALISLVSSLTVAGTLWQWKTKAESLPRIHDVSTDTDNPPLFKAILPLRKDAPNPADYGGPDIAAKQQAGYPDIGPLMLPVAPGEVFQKALSAAINMGGEIIEANRDAGLIEATYTTYWFGFKDDMVVRITPEKTGSRIDVRSVSRVGVSDVGTNAKRIRRFLENMSK